MSASSPLSGPARVLVVGSGGREHALAWKLRRSPSVAEVFVAPGNGGTAAEAGVRNVPISDVAALADWAQEEAIDLTVVGPEAPLAAGLVDLFRARGLAVFGPTRAAAQLESSKAFSKAFMARHGIPTAAYETFSDPAAAHAYIDRMGAPIVVKADGLAAGKGVVVAMTLEEAHEAVRFMLEDNKFGVQHNAGGARVVIEEFLQGEEASFIVICDGQTVVPLASSQDHKRLLDGDQGPNTGGMGAYSPAPVVTPQIHRKVMEQIILPTVAAMAAEGTPYTGFLYAGLMVTPQGEVKTLEFNCRMGDPETQPILMRLQSDLADVLRAAAAGTLAQTPYAQGLQWDSRAALGVVLAAEGYPLSPRKGDPITQLPVSTDEAKLFHAGTALKDGQLLTSGGRVLCATALGADVREARSRAYALAEGVAFAGMQYRRDIGHRAVR